MHGYRDIDEVTVDLSSYTTEESCIWLLNALNAHKFTQDPYTLPFSTYVLSWHKAVPLTCIIMGQSPYPNNIFPPIAAAMSFDEDLCLECPNIQKKVPPTVEILANDLYLNAGMDKDSTIQIIKNGWMLVEGGILLVNECAFYNSNHPLGYKESINQCNVLLRLLYETEKYGKRTVEIYAMGESGERMGSDLCSWYKSDKVKLTKRKATHPAALSRRFTDFSHTDCHMGVQSFSKGLAKHLSNYVASLHTMNKKQEQNLKLQRQIDAYRNLGRNLPEYQKDTINLCNSLKELREMAIIDNDQFNRVLDKIIANGETFASRTSLIASLMTNVGNVTENMSSNVSKPGPHMKTIEPLSGSQIPESSNASHVASTDVVFRKKKGPKSQTTESSFAQVTPPASVQSVDNTMTSELSFRKKRIPKSANSTPSKTITESEVSTASPSDTRKVSRPEIKSTDFRKQNLTDTTPKLGSSGQVKDDKYALTKEQINQLSSVRAVVQMNKPDAVDDPDAVEQFDNIDHDVQAKIKLNSIVYELVDCIEKDLKAIPGFDFAQWAVPNQVHSETFDKCRQHFDF